MRTLSILTLSVAILAACDDRGIAIVVHPPADPAAPPVDEVRLYISTGGPHASTSGVDQLVPAGFSRTTAPRDATYWLRDPTNEADRVTLASPTAAARFVFTPGDADQLSAVIAVGFTDGAPTSSVALFDATMPTDHVDLYEVGLNPSVDAVPTTAAIHQLRLWGPAVGDQTCVMARSSRGDGDPDYRNKTVFIVTDGDPDCDGFATDDARECRDLVHRGQGGVPHDKLSCITTARIPAANGGFDASVLGGPTCKDGEPGALTSCGPGDYCLPSAVHAACTSLDCAASAPPQAPHIECTFNLIGDVAGLQLCPELPALPPSWSGGQQCTGEYSARAPMDVWSDRLVSDGAKVTFGSPTAACKFAPSAELLNTTPGVPPPPMTGIVTVGIVGGRGIAMPLRVSFSPVADCQLAVEPFCKVVVEPTQTDRQCVGSQLD